MSQAQGFSVPRPGTNVTNLANLRQQVAPKPAPAPAPTPVPARAADPTISVGLDTLGGFELLQRQAKLFCMSDIVPDTYRMKHKDDMKAMSNCVIALNMAYRLQADPMSVMQQLYIVHGRPGWSSAFLIATFNKSGKYAPISYQFEGKEGTDSWGCRAISRDLATNAELIGPAVTIAMAKAEGWVNKNGSKWRTMPELMLRYRAAAFLIRTTAPEISMGILTAEEVNDVWGKSEQPYNNAQYAHAEVIYDSLPEQGVPTQTPPPVQQNVQQAAPVQTPSPAQPQPQQAQPAAKPAAKPRRKASQSQSQPEPVSASQSQPEPAQQSQPEPAPQPSQPSQAAQSSSQPGTAQQQQSQQPPANVNVVYEDMLEDLHAAKYGQQLLEAVRANYSFGALEAKYYAVAPENREEIVSILNAIASQPAQNQASKDATEYGHQIMLRFNELLVKLKGEKYEARLLDSVKRENPMYTDAACRKFFCDNPNIMAARITAFQNALNGAL